MKGLLTFSAISLCLVMSASADLAPNLSIPDLKLNAPDFVTQFTNINNELNRINLAGVPAFQRLIRHIENVGIQIRNQLNTINRKVTNVILSNTNITPTQNVQLVTQLFAAYQKASDAIDKELMDQTKAANDNFAKLKIKETVTALNAIITTAINDQQTASKDLVALPGKLRDNLATQYKGISDAIVAIETVLNTPPKP